MMNMALTQRYVLFRLVDFCILNMLIYFLRSIVNRTWVYDICRSLYPIFTYILHRRNVFGIRVVKSILVAQVELKKKRKKRSMSTIPWP